MIYTFEFCGKPEEFDKKASEPAATAANNQLKFVGRKFVRFEAPVILNTQYMV